ncbi:Uncharacterised protein [Corynebacterium kutscheri]|uniref:Uncharacterized protein n=1 Tax=Corynebacterium kutscheri TaxID=35755 RepID=A0A0F6TE87_9CORY|nr:hypothetical protein [Corynebacterium kutscheri]AKE41884.1 hypothetical protein UL82_08640 [Corynebacterium kutscheri]VEH04418.1 Uncharacterised protein [Corynebacterium kutscheri]VEH10212.1 Uncharacterised protein [Corynebacterium kutscheri]VEH80294.1 Uncharacterised protein [Corynebacterium kutscheri]
MTAYDLDAQSYHEAAVTIWFINAADPRAVIESRPRADRGFGRKYLAQLNPRWPITPIGQFALNRSAQASPGEFYIAGLPGVAIVHTVLSDAAWLSKIDPAILTSIPAADVYAFTTNTHTGLGGFAHFRGGKVLRSFSARRQRVYEDIGVPEPFEAPFWAGEKASATGGIDLPFIPIELAEEAQQRWLGIDIKTAPDINVVAYAIDGRPEPKQHNYTALPQPSMAELATEASTKLGLGIHSDYDDYEDFPDDYPDLDNPDRQPTSEKLTTLAQSSWQHVHRNALHAKTRVSEFSNALRKKLGR